jgi:DNA (cytosine-5)-methyltransferase 1
MTQDGIVYQQKTLARPTIEIGSGLSEKFPTPTVCGNYNRKGASANSGDGLATYVRKFPTPTATAYKGWSKNHNRASTDDRLDYTVEREAHEAGLPGRLNPDWEEWLMAWPIGWTALKPLEMAKFQEWQQQHSPCLPADSTDAA